MIKRKNVLTKEDKQTINLEDISDELASLYTMIALRSVDRYKDYKIKGKSKWKKAELVEFLKGPPAPAEPPAEPPFSPEKQIMLLKKRIARYEKMRLVAISQLQLMDVNNPNNPAKPENPKKRKVVFS